MAAKTGKAELHRMVTRMSDQRLVGKLRMDILDREEQNSSHFEHLWNMGIQLVKRHSRIKFASRSLAIFSHVLYEALKGIAQILCMLTSGKTAPSVLGLYKDI